MKIITFLLLILLILNISTITGCGLFYDFESASSHDDEDIYQEGAGVKDNDQSNAGTGDPGQNETGNNDIFDTAIRYRVAEVIDGDTIILSNGSRIRLLGINTPEAGMYFYEEAREILEIMILGKEVYLEKDISDYDQYGRKLRYVYLDGLFVNLEMVGRGFANIFTNPPDVKYADDLLEAERFARSNDLGLWEMSWIDIVSVEVFYDAPGNDNENINGEYVTLDNIGKDVLNTGGWTIKDSGTNIYRFGAFEFYPGSRITLLTGKGKDGDGDLYWNSIRPVWNNDHDTLYLRDGEGLLIEIYNY